MMPDSIIVPEVDPNYDLAVINSLQSALLPYEVWWSLGLWALFAATLSFVFYHYVLSPYLK